MLVRDLMTQKPIVVAPEMSVPDALTLLRGRKIHHLPVVDEKGRLIGIVTEQDQGIGCLPVVDGTGGMTGLVTKADLFRAFMELLGGRRRGVRVWAQTPDTKGTIAKITGAIAAISGDIVGLGFNEIRDLKGSRWEITLKVQDVKADKLAEAIRPFVIDIKDVRES